MTTLPGVDVDSETQIGLTGAYMPSNNIGVELLAATPFKHDINVAGVLAGSTKQLPPTLRVHYYFGGSSSKFRP